MIEAISDLALAGGCSRSSRFQFDRLIVGANCAAAAAAANHGAGNAAPATTMAHSLQRRRRWRSQAISAICNGRFHPEPTGVTGTDGVAQGSAAPIRILSMRALLSAGNSNRCRRRAQSILAILAAIAAGSSGTHAPSGVPRGADGF